MTARFTKPAMVAFALLTLAACGDTEGSRALSGGAIGAGGGAIIGGATGLGPADGALLGAGAGAITGAASTPHN